MEPSLFCIKFLVSLVAKFLKCHAGRRDEEKWERISCLWLKMLIVLEDLSVDNDKLFFIIVIPESLQILSFQSWMLLNIGALEHLRLGNSVLPLFSAATVLKIIIREFCGSFQNAQCCKSHFAIQKPGEMT